MFTSANNRKQRELYEKRIPSSVCGRYFVVKDNEIFHEKRKPRGKEIYFNTEEEAIQYVIKKTRNEALSSLKKTLNAISYYEHNYYKYGFKNNDVLFPPINSLNTGEFWNETGIHVTLESLINAEFCKDAYMGFKATFVIDNEYFEKKPLSNIFLPLISLPQKILLYLGKKIGVNNGKINKRADNNACKKWIAQFWMSKMRERW